MSLEVDDERTTGRADLVDAQSRSVRHGQGALHPTEPTAGDPTGPLAPELIPLPPAPTGVDDVMVDCDYGGSSRMRTTQDLIDLNRKVSGGDQVSPGAAAQEWLAANGY